MKIRRKVDECETSRCQFCWRVTLYPEGIEEEAPTEVNAAAKETEEENLQKIVLGLDQMFIAEEVPIGDEVECDNEGLNADDDVKWVQLVEIPEDLPEKPKVQRKKSHQKILNLLRYFFLLHFQRAKKVSTKTGMSTKTVSTKIGMDCTCMIFGPDIPGDY